jgi:hypothetical protein
MGLDLMANLRARAAEAPPPPVMGMSDKDVPAPPEDVIPAAFAAPATQPTMLGINPPEKDLPPAPPVGIAEAKPKRGRPAGSKNKTGAELTKEMEANAKPPTAAEVAATFPNLGTSGDVPMVRNIEKSGGIDFQRIATSFKALEAICASLSEAFGGAK